MMRDRKPNILIIEKSEHCRNLYQAILSRHNLHVHLEENGKAALKLLQDGLTCSVIVTDYDLPDINGISLLDPIQKLSPDSAKILVSAMDESEIKFSHKNIAADFQFSNKPLNVKELIGIVLNEVHRNPLPSLS
ncbi:MAG: response regulator [Nitrospinaceae bacterium]|nr:response regulator [Nitrospinaceae bacterium]NIR53915.1 response regulator [Nitrospinaceae bacterium]NIS84332.1 response regulator [Nitrospinaceae bacterium]NIT81136.1 response regulator [Nitrospinaceae bacterium]NIU43418.1 response regulator [Nitrospinaceae bacterium]